MPEKESLASDDPLVLPEGFKVRRLEIGSHKIGLEVRLPEPLSWPEIVSGRIISKKILDQYGFMVLDGTIHDFGTGENTTPVFSEREAQPEKYLGSSQEFHYDLAKDRPAPDLVVLQGSQPLQKKRYSLTGVVHEEDLFHLIANIFRSLPQEGKLKVLQSPMLLQGQTGHFLKVLHSTLDLTTVPPTTLLSDVERYDLFSDPKKTEELYRKLVFRPQFITNGEVAAQLAASGTAYFHDYTESPAGALVISNNYACQIRHGGIARESVVSKKQFPYDRQLYTLGLVRKHLNWDEGFLPNG